MHKDNWTKGETAYFEYHCWQSHDSADADLWYRSHQPVSVVAIDRDSNGAGDTLEERSDNGEPRTYHIQFADGHRGAAFEDELLTDPAHFDPAGKPPPKSERRPLNPRHGA